MVDDIEPQDTRRIVSAADVDDRHEPAGRVVAQIRGDFDDVLTGDRYREFAVGYLGVVILSPNLPASCVESP